MTVKYYTDEAGTKKIVLKEGRVSCSCCEECCMYPAQALVDGEYSIGDLPDTVVQVDTSDPPIETVFTKHSSPQTGDGAGGSGTPIEYYSGTDSFGQTVGVGFYSGDESPKGWKGTRIPNEGAEFGFCLLEILTVQPDPLVWAGLQDQFADTYTVSGPISGTVTRESICVWRGASLTLSNYGYQWKVNGNDKSGFQNTPVGSYAGGYTVS